MKIKYSPCKTDKDTSIKYIDENSIKIDEELYEFDIQSVKFPDVAEQTDSLIIRAYREDDELYLTVTRFYSGDCTSWDTGGYHEISG